MFPGVLYAGTGQNVVKVGEKHLLPCLTKSVLIGMEARPFPGGGPQNLRVAQLSFQTAVALLDAALGRITAGRKVIDLVVDHRQFLPDAFRGVEELPHRPETKSREYGPPHHFLRKLDIPPGRPAAVVAHAIDGQPGFQPGTAAGDQRRGNTHAGRDRRVVPERLPIGQQLAAGGRAVAVKDLVLPEPAAVVEIPDSGEGVHLRQRGVMAEGVGGEVDLKVLHAPFFGKILPGVGNMPQHGFGIGHIMVGLHPRGRGAFPAAFPNTPPDLLHHVRVVFFHDLIDRRLRLGKMKVRIFFHQGQHGAEGSQRGGHRLRVAPHPVHVDVGVSGQDQLVAFRLLMKRLKQLLRLLTDGVAQYTFFFHGLEQHVQRTSDRLVERPVFPQVQRELQLAENAGVPLIRARDMRLFLFGHAKGILVSRDLAISADGGLQANELFGQHIAHGFVFSSIFKIGIRFHMAWRRGRPLLRKNRSYLLR